MTQNASLIAAGGVLLFAVAWFLVKAIVGHIMAHWMMARWRKQGWGRPKKEQDKSE